MINNIASHLGFIDLERYELVTMRATVGYPIGVPDNCGGWFFAGMLDSSTALFLRDRSCFAEAVCAGMRRLCGYSGSYTFVFGTASAPDEYSGQYMGLRGPTRDPNAN